MKRKTNSKWASHARPDGTFDFESLTRAEKEAFYAECEQVDASTPAQELTPAQKQAHKRVLGRGRPRIGQGTQRTQLTVERGLLQETDRFAKSHGLTRSRVVAEALRAYLPRVA